MDLDDLAGPVARGALLLPRLGWFMLVFLFEGPGWWIGWPVCRVLSAGQFPREAFAVQDDAPLVIQLIVEFVGLLTCAAFLILVGEHLLGLPILDWLDV